MVELQSHSFLSVAVCHPLVEKRTHALPAPSNHHLRQSKHATGRSSTSSENFFHPTRFSSVSDSEPPLTFSQSVFQFTHVLNPDGTVATNTSMRVVGHSYLSPVSLWRTSRPPRFRHSFPTKPFSFVSLVISPVNVYRNAVPHWPTVTLRTRCEPHRSQKRMLTSTFAIKTRLNNGSGSCRSTLNIT